MKTAIALPIDQITKLCQHWQIIELSLFGSILRDDFHEDSDIDILVAFAPTANWGLLDHAQMQEELEALLSRPVDLISKRAIERSSNWIRRQEILSTAQTIYVK
ncbi:MAG: nucleotidyltransferase [Oscillatoriales cyanobacterium]|uniref:nucleotidyltransferase family protein n=1 Tax=Microcoleus sp. PH2017_05_CCC_O_A TaxID=2798816 RepID=UPI001E197BDC|nr:nucleotidyltransferase family protein [Microcoleus sp. PH2017_05_CCC_O_A]MCC3435939.1 nucleotidyltransferase family protein [Microcoleus sp. PH2017_05_CCC_O_A]TAG19408.1 MAG: nucleotidyltransferase [Oscillatoriales cyanobacterium]